MITPLCNRVFCCILGWYFYVKSVWNMKKIFCCPALELFHCLPLWKTVLFVSSSGQQWGYMEKSYKMQQIICQILLLKNVYKTYTFIWTKHINIKAKMVKCGACLKHLKLGQNWPFSLMVENLRNTLSAMFMWFLRDRDLKLVKIFIGWILVDSTGKKV